ncbi:MAG TPA: EamA family transporter RarD [Gemmataceae bacterium]|nr:EamA family transporter RarD [Gemmataceae bacterium]
MSDSDGARYRSGLIFGLVAYSWWGLVPLYFAALKSAEVPAAEILGHRIAWSLPIMLVLVWIIGGWKDLWRVLKSRKLVLTLLLSSTLLAVNWLLYIYATVTSRVAEASLGYYMMPLVNAALATWFLGEKLRPAHYPALALVALGVCVPFFVYGKFTWIAVALPITFGIYGLVRKRVPVESTTGLTVETILMLIPSVGYLLFLGSMGKNHFGANWSLNALLAFSGVVTVVPLLTYTLSLRRLPLIALSFLQFLSPTIQMVLAITLLGETLTPDKIIAFACVWAAVAIFIADAVAQVREKRSRDVMGGTGGLSARGSATRADTPPVPPLPAVTR